MNAAAAGEVLEAYRRQIRRALFADRAETTHWRLAVLDVLFDAAALLPAISRAYAAGPRARATAPPGHSAHAA